MGKGSESRRVFRHGVSRRVAASAHPGSLAGLQEPRGERGHTGTRHAGHMHPGSTTLHPNATDTPPSTYNDSPP
eukprot:scaffold7488_cov149-Isochrysis_galbana.AAC.3